MSSPKDSLNFGSFYINSNRYFLECIIDVFYVVLSDEICVPIPVLQIGHSLKLTIFQYDRIFTIRWRLAQSYKQSHKKYFILLRAFNFHTHELLEVGTTLIL